MILDETRFYDTKNPCMMRRTCWFVWNPGFILCLKVCQRFSLCKADKPDCSVGINAELSCHNLTVEAWSNEQCSLCIHLPPTMSCICHRKNYQTTAGQRVVQVHINQGTFTVWCACLLQGPLFTDAKSHYRVMYDLRVMVAVVCNLTSSIFGQALNNFEQCMSEYRTGELTTS